jgi:ribosomal protein L15
MAPRDFSPGSKNMKSLNRKQRRTNVKRQGRGKTGRKSRIWT